MRIAQVAPLMESVPPALYGGTERVVAYLTNALVALGHDVTLFGSADSRTDAALVPICPRALRLDESCQDYLAWHMLMVEWLAQQAVDFDVIHFHIAHVHFPLARRLGVPSVTTLHGRLDMPELAPLYGEFRDLPMVSISDAQRAPLPMANWLTTIPHGLPRDRLAAGDGGGGYFAFLGRICPEKRPDRAIRIATALGIPLKIAAKVDAADRDYYEREIRPLLVNPLVEFVGEIGEDQKGAFLGGARALLFPIDWPEPFGLVLIESLACGTPVVAYRAGSVPEIIEDGTTGFLVSTLEDAIAAAGRVGTLDRRACRRAFDERFSADHMAERYVAAYERVIAATTRDAA